MQVVFTWCAGIDVHKKIIVVCVTGPNFQESRTFGAMTNDLLELADWLRALGVTHVAMESTGVYWKPVYNILEDYGFELLVVNAQHMKAVPGRKTDIKDAQWIADLLRHGLLKSSYIPSQDQRELRELVRYRKSLIGERSSEVARLQKVLEGANIKLSSVASDVTGKSGRAMLQALIAGNSTPDEMAELAHGRLKAKIPQLKLALHGRMGPHQRMLLTMQLRHIDFLEAQIEQLSHEIGDRMHPFDDDLTRLATVDGVGLRTAQMVLAEIGNTMSIFPTAAHLASWAGLSPGNNESAGKRKSGRTRKGSPWLRVALVEAAQAAARTKNTYLSDKYHRIAARRGAKRAAVAVAHKILVIIYHILKDKVNYKDLGASYLLELKREQNAKRALQTLKGLGYEVTATRITA